MLNNTATKHAPLNGRPVDPAKAASYCRSKARCAEAAAKGSFGWRREAYLKEARQWQNVLLTYHRIAKAA